MEEEEKAAQSAKLQELIRRGGPEDLQEANRLMKVMAGYDTRQKTDYRAKAAEEVGKVQQKARLLEERLAEFKPGDKMTEGDVYEELASALQSAHPKIQKMCEEESDDHEAVAKLLEINDSIHRTVERYKLMKKGDVEAASKIEKGTLGTSTGVNAANELSLIDFGGEETNGAASAGPSADSQPGGLEDDLLGLSMGESYGQGGGIALGFGNHTSKFAEVWEHSCPNYYRYPWPSINIIDDRAQHSTRTYTLRVSSPFPNSHQTRLFCLFRLRLRRHPKAIYDPSTVIIPTTTTSSCCCSQSSNSTTFACRPLCRSYTPHPPVYTPTNTAVYVRFREPQTSGCCPSCSNRRR